MRVMDLYEQWTFRELGKAGLRVFVPFKDKGVDAVVFTANYDKRSRIQIKGSTGYADGGGWYRINISKLTEATKTTDYWVFVMTVRGKYGRLSPAFVAIPPDELLRRLNKYSNPSKGRFDFCLGKGMLSLHEAEICDDRGLTKAGKGVTSLDLLPGYPDRIYTAFLVKDVKDWSEALELNR